MEAPKGPPGPAGFIYELPVLANHTVRVVFRVGAIEQVAVEAHALGNRVLLIAGSHEAGPAEAVAAALGAALAGRLHEVTQHVPVEVVAAATTRARRVGADLLVAIGGGSATGLAKAVALETGLPVLAVPTTYAGSEMTPVWGLTGPAGKTTGRDPRVLPRTVVYDPVLTTTLPVGLSAASGMNALAHAVESLYAPDSTALLATVAEQAIRALAAGLGDVVADPESLQARSDALYGAWLAGWTLGATTMGLHHKLAHVLGGTYRLSHAEVHSVLLPQVAAFNAAAAPHAFTRAAKALHVAGPDDVAPALYDLARRLGAPTALATLGLPDKALREVAATTAAADIANPRPVNAADLLTLLRHAQTGRADPAKSEQKTRVEITTEQMDEDDEATSSIELDVNRT